MQHLDKNGMPTMKKKILSVGRWLPTESCLQHIAFRKIPVWFCIWSPGDTGRYRYCWDRSHCCVVRFYAVSAFIWNVALQQGCGAETIFFRSGSDFQKVPAPEPAPATALELPVFTDFMLKRIFFMFLMKKNRPNSHVRSYSIWI
jgi:hypothetical protein